jgi:hypothetical protein
MVIIVPQLAGPAGVIYIAVSVPRTECLVDGVKYMEPSDNRYQSPSQRSGLFAVSSGHVTE